MLLARSAATNFGRLFARSADRAGRATPRRAGGTGGDAPSWLRADHCDLRPGRPDGHRDRVERPCLRGREERSDQDVPEPLRHDARRRSRTCARRCTTSPAAVCLGSRSTRASRPIRTSISTTRSTPRSGARAHVGSAGQTHDHARATLTRSTASCPPCLPRAGRGRADVRPRAGSLNDWCQQFQFHTGGGLEFGADGYLYVSGGDGARWGIFDYGQLGFPITPAATRRAPSEGRCRRPPRRAGGCARRTCAPAATRLGWRAP